MAVPLKTYLCAAALLVAVTALSGCGGGGSDDKSSDSSLTAPFAYDSSKPLDLKSRSSSNVKGGGVKVQDISFTGPSGDLIRGFLVEPRSAGPHPAVIYVHGAGGDRLEMLDKAIALARRGVVGLTMDMSYSPLRAKSLPPGMPGVRQRANTEVESVREVRRAVDLLQSQDSVDDNRIGYVGWSAGARMGAIVAGVDHRIKAFDLLAGGSTPISDYVRLAPANLRAELNDVLGKTDPMRYVGHAKPSALLFQDGRRDELVPQAALKTLYRTGSEPKELRWYDTGHVPGNRAWRDSRAWLSEKLGLTQT